ncbi:MAG TPA: oxygenase MpaB family protein [Chitinophagaceae bacterium]|nr:oxygenase MpaB family protein [Chitinophagaceae bacterium]
MVFFVSKESVVRKIWGKGDIVMFIFAGASAEFALNKAVDWLYFTGRLPSDPLSRLFSTLKYAQEIVFSENETALKAIDKIAAIHTSVENSRGSKIPDWAYRDVLFMLIHYSLAAYELLERKMTDKEKEDLFDVFNRMGLRMGLEGLPGNYNDWLIMRKEHMENDLVKSDFTIDLFKQYRKHLGWLRYRLLIETQKKVVPVYARKLLKMNSFSWLTPVLIFYKLSRKVKLDWFLKSLVLPSAYKKQIREMDIAVSQ